MARYSDLTPELRRAVRAEVRARRREREQAAEDAWSFVALAIMFFGPMALLHALGWAYRLGVLAGMGAM